MLAKVSCPSSLPTPPLPEILKILELFGQYCCVGKHAAMLLTPILDFVQTG